MLKPVGGGERESGTMDTQGDLDKTSQRLCTVVLKSLAVLIKHTLK